MVKKLIKKVSTTSVGDENCHKEPRLILRFALIDTVVAVLLLLIISGVLFIVRNQRVETGTAGVPVSSDVTAQVKPFDPPEWPPFDEPIIGPFCCDTQFMIERVNGVLVSQTTPIRVEVGDWIQYALYYKPFGTDFIAPTYIYQTYNPAYLQYVGIYNNSLAPKSIEAGEIIWSNDIDIPAFEVRVIKSIYRALKAGNANTTATNIKSLVYNKDADTDVECTAQRIYTKLQIDNPPPPAPIVSLSTSKLLTPATVDPGDMVRVSVAVNNTGATTLTAPVSVTLKYDADNLRFNGIEKGSSGLANLSASSVTATQDTGTLAWSDVTGGGTIIPKTAIYFAVRFIAKETYTGSTNSFPISVVAKDVYGKTAQASFTVKSLTIKPLPKPEPKPTPTPEPTALQRIQDFFNLTPQQENVVKTVIAPSTAIINAINLAAAANPINIGYLFLLLFTEPFQFILRRKRGNTSVIYNALSKHPLALVMVRLVEAKTGRIVKTAVTDPKGRFALSGPPGQYRIQVKKSGFTFPSETVSGVRDSGFANIYHGDVFELTEDNPMVVASIPLDPPKTEKTRQAVRRSNFYRIFQNVIAWVGIVIAVILVILAPSALTISLLIAHVLFFFLFRYFARLQAPPTWGQVYDFLTGRPVRGAVVRIYDAQYERLLDSKVTNIRGRYGFLVGQNEYLLDAAKSGYDFPAPEKKKPDDYLGGKFTPRKGSIKMNIPIKPKRA